MLTLISGKAVAGQRAASLAAAVSDHTLFVVPDELTANALTTEISRSAGSGSIGSTVVDFATFIAGLTASAPDRHTWVSPEVSLAIIRSILEQDPAAFDYIVGKHSVPRLSHGVLERIAASVEALQKAQDLEDLHLVTAGQRGRQLQELANRLANRLSAAGSRLEKHGRMEAITKLTAAQWKSQYPDLKHVIYLDFLQYTDLHYLTANAVSRHVKQCDVLLDFDPEDDSLAMSSLETAYQRFYEMADREILHPASPVIGQAELFDAPAENLPDVQRPYIVEAESLAQETAAATAAISHLLKTSSESGVFIVVALAHWEAYAPILGKEFADFGVDAQWQQHRAVLQSGEWTLLTRLRDCSGHNISGSAVSALLRAPGFYRLLPEAVSSIEAWDLASRLDYVLTLTGKLVGWAAILKETSFVLDRMRKDRQRQHLWSEEEGVHDERLRYLLRECQAVLKLYAETLPLEDWVRITLSVLHAARPHGHLADPESHRLQQECNGLLKSSAIALGTHAELLSPEPMSYSKFLSLYRTVVYRQSADNITMLQGKGVVVCDANTAAKLNSDCCMLLGFNDGNFPRFAKPEASLLNRRSVSSQAAFRAHQKVILKKLLRSHSRTLLWVPARAGTEELLPSQYAEELYAHERASKTTAEELLQLMGAPAAGALGAAKADFVNTLKGVALNEAELKRFRQRNARAYQIAYSTTIMSYRNQLQLGGYDGIIADPHLQKWLSHWAEHHIYSVSQLDSVVGCSFRFFVDRILNLEEQEEADDLLPAHVFGSFSHEVLAKFYRRWVEAGRQVPQPSDEQLARHQLYAAYLESIDDVTDLSDFAMDLMQLKLFGDFAPEDFGNGSLTFDEVKNVGVFGQFLQMEMRRGIDTAEGYFRPAGFEVGFGMGPQQIDDPLSMPETLTLDLGNGETVKLRGRIDRIDLSPDGVFAVTDYKTGWVPQKKEIVTGYRTQLPVYVMVGEKLLQRAVKDPVPAGGLYYSLKRSDDAKVSGVFFRKTYQRQAGIAGRSCLSDEEFFQTLEDVKQIMRKSLRSVAAGKLTTTWRDSKTVCGFCAFEGFCYRNVERTQAYWESLEAADAER